VEDADDDVPLTALALPMFVVVVVVVVVRFVSSGGVVDVVGGGTRNCDVNESTPMFCERYLDGWDESGPHKKLFRTYQYTYTSSSNTNSNSNDTVTADRHLPVAQIFYLQKCLVWSRMCFFSPRSMPTPSGRAVK
jgi:hypothetical protein